MENKNEMQSEERIDLETWREDVREELSSTIQDGEHLMRSIRRTRESYQREAASSEPKHAPAFYQVLDRLFEQFEKEMENVRLPEPLPEPYDDSEYAECWSFAYEIENCGLKLSLVLLTWDYDGGEVCSTIAERFTALNVPARLLTVSDYAKLYGLEPGDVYRNAWDKRVEGAVRMNGEWYIPELADLSDSSGRVDIIYFYR